MLPFLEHDGVEVSNANRWLAYLANGMKPGGGLIGAYDVITTLVCAGLNFEAEPVMPVAGFSSPAADPAPWYDATVPASAEFLGLLVQNIKGLDGVTTRSTTPRQSGIGGATLGPQITNPRALIVNGTLLSTSCRGLEYGKRWLAGVLASEDQSCNVAETHMRYCCPTGSGGGPLYPQLTGLYPSDTLYPSDGTYAAVDGLAIAYQTGLTSGPDEVEPDRARSGLKCEMVDVTFTITAGNPFLYGAGVIVLGPAYIAEASSPGCMSFYHWGFESGPVQVVSVPVPSKFGATGLIATISAGGGTLSGFRIFAYDDPNGLSTNSDNTTSTSDTTGTATPTRGGPVGAIENPELYAGVSHVQVAEVKSLPAGAVMVYDSAKRTVRVTLADGTVEDGIAYLDLDLVSLTWIELGEGDSGSIVGVQLETPCGANPDAQVMIATQRRER